MKFLEDESTWLFGVTSLEFYKFFVSKNEKDEVCSKSSVRVEEASFNLKESSFGQKRNKAGVCWEKDLVGGIL